MKNQYHRVHVGPDGMRVKFCKGCNTLKLLTDFAVKGKTPAGNPHYNYLCRSCFVPVARARGKRYRTTNPDEYAAYHSTYYRLHRDRIDERRKRYNQTHSETLRAKRRKYREQNKAKLSKLNKAYRDTHRDELNAYLRKYRIESCERLREHDRTRNKTSKRRALFSEKAFRRRAQKQGAPFIERCDRAKIIARDDSTCYLCGVHLRVSDVTLDHVIPLIRGGEHTMENLRVACARCNSKKGSRLLSEVSIDDFPRLRLL
jgi:5-methylcytosine-specific restriction endonuclease McrA